MSGIELDDVGVDLGARRVLDSVTASVPAGAFAAVIGPSGSGKSTVLRTLAGLAPCVEGTVRLDGVDVTSVPTRERGVGMVFQTPVMFTDRSVRRNVAFPLELRRQTVEAIRDRVDAETRAMHMEHLLLSDPSRLSRGEQQLVQIARTMVRAPRLLLLDEPFAPLDAHLRSLMRAEMRLLHDGYGITTLMATNDPDDVAALADHVVVLGPCDGDADGGGAGTVLQEGTPREVADDPVSLGVAGTVAALWHVRAVVAAESSGFWLVVEGHGGRIRAWSPTLRGHVGREVIVGFRSGDLSVSERGELRAVAERVVPGAAEPLLCRIGGRVAQVSMGTFDPATVADAPEVRLSADRMFVFDPVSGARIR